MLVKKPSYMAVFHDKYPLVGPVFWLLSLQYYAVQIWVAAAWQPPFSWLHNTISDLGNTVCAGYDGRFVCSPRHELMNASFVILGVTMVSGSLLIYHEFKKTVASRFGFTGMALAGIGTILVGLFPENTVSGLHEAGAALPFVVGNGALLLLGFGLTLPRWLRIYTVLSGAVALTALPLFLGHHYWRLGLGGSERLVAYPQTIWLMVFGLYMWRNRYRRPIRLKARPRPHAAGR